MEVVHIVEKIKVVFLFFVIFNSKFDDDFENHKNKIPFNKETIPKMEIIEDILLEKFENANNTEPVNTAV